MIRSSGRRTARWYNDLIMSASLTSSDILHIGKLANLQIQDKEVPLLASQLSAIINFVGKLQELPTAGVSETSQVTGLVNVYREDKIDESRVLTQAQALQNAKVTQDGFFVVPAVFSE